MRVFNKRSRIVGFRVSDEEYRRLEKVAQEKGAHNISEYARGLVCPRPGETDDQRIPILASQIRDLQARTDEISSELKRLALAIFR